MVIEEDLKSNVVIELANRGVADNLVVRLVLCEGLVRVKPDDERLFF